MLWHTISPSEVNRIGGRGLVLGAQSDISLPSQTNVQIRIVQSTTATKLGVPVRCKVLHVFIGQSQSIKFCFFLNQV